MSKTVILNATDIDSGSLTFSIQDAPWHGSLGGITGNNVTYTPDPDYNGGDSFTFKASDGSRDSNISNVYIMVDSVNDRPAADNSTIAVDQDDEMTITLQGSDVDQADILTFLAVVSP